MENVIAAMIKLAVSDAVKPEVKINQNSSKHYLIKHATERQHRADALEWIFDNQNCKFSFLWCCSICDIEPDLVRDMIKNRPAALHRRLLDEQYKMNKPQRIKPKEAA